MRLPGGNRAAQLLHRARRSEIRALSGDAFYVSVWQGSAVAAELVQVSLMTHLLGLADYGRYSLVIAFAALVGGVFKVRPGYTVVAFGAAALGRDRREAAGMFQLTFGIDVISAVAAFVVLAGLAPFVGDHVTDDAGLLLILLAGLTLVAAGADETCASVLRLLDRFRLVASYFAVTELLRLVLVVVALVVYESLAAVLIAMIIAKLARAVIGVIAVMRVFDETGDGVSLARPSIRHIPRDERKSMFKMMFHTNFTTYGRAAQAQLPTLMLGGIAGATETGIYKVGTAAALALGKVIDPASTALLPRVAKYWSNGQVRQVRRLIRNTSLISVPSMLLLLALMIVFQEPILHLLGGAEAASSEAGTVLIVAGLSHVAYGAVFWHTTVLLAARRAAVVSMATLASAALQVVLVLVLVPSYGAVGAAVALLLGRVINNAVLMSMSLRLLRSQETSPAQPTRPQRPSSHSRGRRLGRTRELWRPHRSRYERNWL